MECGIAFALVLAVVFAAFRTKETNTKRIVIFSAMLTGLIGSIVIAILRSIPNYINRTNFAFFSIIPVVAGFLSLIVLFSLKKRFVSSHSVLYERLFSGAVFLYTVSGVCYYLPVIIGLISTFTDYGESPISTMVLFRVTGFVFGFLIIILIHIALYRTLMKLSDIELTVAFNGALSILGITQLFVIIQRLYSLRIIPRNDLIFTLIAFVANHLDYFVFAIVIFTLFPPVLLWKKNMKITEPYQNSAEHRKLRAKQRNEKRLSRFSLFLLFICVISVSVLPDYVNREVPLSEPENYTIADGLAIITLESLEDEKLHRYEYTTKNDIKMRFIALKKSEGAYGVGLDACEICGPSGYFERNGDIVCKLCDVVMNRATIGFPGGCNPVPVPYIVHDKKIKIKVQDLEAEEQRFR